MIGISNSTADEVILVISELRKMTEDVAGDRAANMRRRGINIIRYINKKKNGKKEEIIHPS